MHRGDEIYAKGRMGLGREMQSAAAYAVEVNLPRLGRLPGRSRGVRSAAAYAIEVALPGSLRRAETSPEIQLRPDKQLHFRERFPLAVGNAGGRLRLHMLQRIALPLNAPVTFLNEEGRLRLHMLQRIASPVKAREGPKCGPTRQGHEKPSKIWHVVAHPRPQPLPREKLN